jgi:hydrogenase expression/formation protein HypD
VSDPAVDSGATASAGARPRLHALAPAHGEGRSVTVMEVCGTHTMAISRFGLRQLLPPSLRLVSGPGCPVCVTATGDLDVAVALARLPQVTLVTFGDLMRVPASRSTLADERAAGADVRVVYSAADAVDLAAALRDREVVFVGIGFETTAPTVAAAVLSARDRGLSNFSLLSLHKTMPGALRALLAANEVAIDGFLLPGHVSVITGSECYRFVADEYGAGGVIAGFEAEDVLEALVMLARQRAPAIEIGYRRAVRPEGNVTAQRLMARVFEPCDAAWRGLGVIPGSGLRLASGFREFAAEARLPVDAGETIEPPGCACGAVLRGVLEPADCPLFAVRCTPAAPVGPCMVSSEGSCAARYRYRGVDAGGGAAVTQAADDVVTGDGEVGGVGSRDSAGEVGP